MRRALLLMLTLALVLAGCTGSERDELDADGDLVDDAVETEGKTIEITTATGTERRHVTSDPGRSDTDGDGLGDADELLVRGSDPRDVDTDDDGLLDGDDQAAPDDDVAASWRAAGVIEVGGTFLGELDACAPGGPQLRANVASSDLPVPDQLLDGEELRGWDIFVGGATRHVVSDPCATDTDGDGLLDHDEKLRLSDPRSADTDGDGTRDIADGDPSADVALRFADLDVSLGGNDTTVRVLFDIATGSADLSWPGNATATLDVPDAASASAFEVSVIVTAEDLRTGERLALTADERGAIVTFDLRDGTASGVETQGALLRFQGSDGSMTLSWSVVRR
jgi:hypothetical protein